MSSILLISILWLYIGAVAIYPIGRYLRNKTGYLSAFIIGVATLLYLSIANDISSPYVEEYHWVLIPQVLKISFALVADYVNYIIGLTILIVTFFAAIYSVTYMEHEHALDAYFFLYTVYSAGMLGAVLSMDLIQFLFFWEAMLVPSYILIGVWGYGDRRRVAYKYFIYTQLGTILLIISFAILGLYSNGNFDISAIYLIAHKIPSNIRLLLAGLMIAGFGVKMAIVPLHGWLPEAHAEAPTPISVILSGVMIEVGLYALIRITLPLTFPTWHSSDMMTLLTILALISMFYGGMMALVQDDVKRLLAYSSISQMGYMFLGVAAANPISIEGSILHVFSHGLLKGLLFMVAGVLIHQIGIRDMRKLGGLAVKMPITASLAVIGAMGIAGLPGISSFISEFLIFTGVFNSSIYNKILILFMAVLATGLTAAYMTLFIKRVFFGPLPKELENARDPDMNMIIPMTLMAVIAIVVGVYPSIILDYIAPGMEPFFKFIREVWG